jgi:hypothetical protein
MKLYDVPRNTKIRVMEDAKIPPAHRDIDEDEILMFHHVDGMYSLCSDSQGNAVHIAAWTEVEIVQ